MDLKYISEGVMNIKEPSCQLLGRDGEKYLVKIVFPVEDGDGNLVGRRGVILCVKPEDLPMHHKDGELIQKDYVVEISSFEEMSKQMKKEGVKTECMYYVIDQKNELHEPCPRCTQRGVFYKLNGLMTPVCDGCHRYAVKITGDNSWMKV